VDPKWCIDNFKVKMHLKQDLTYPPRLVDTWEIISYPFKIYNLKPTGSDKSKKRIVRYEVEPGRFIKYSPDRQK
jgi:hypothetical protein